MRGFFTPPSEADSARGAPLFPAVDRLLGAFNSCEVTQYDGPAYGVGFTGWLPPGAVLAVGTRYVLNKLRRELLANADNADASTTIWESLQAFSAAATTPYDTRASLSGTGVLLLGPGESFAFPHPVDGLCMTPIAMYVGYNNGSYGYDTSFGAAACRPRAVARIYTEPMGSAPELVPTRVPWTDTGVLASAALDWDTAVWCAPSSELIVAVEADYSAAALELHWYLDGVGWVHNEADDWSAGNRGLPTADHNVESYAVPSGAQMLQLIKTSGTPRYTVVQV